MVLVLMVAALVAALVLQRIKHRTRDAHDAIDGVVSTKKVKQTIVEGTNGTNTAQHSTAQHDAWHSMAWDGDTHRIDCQGSNRIATGEGRGPWRGGAAPIVLLLENNPSPVRLPSPPPTNKNQWTRIPCVLCCDVLCCAVLRC
mmetsp:Transcript_110529/g.226119  ORF Transcript_110529/g.226119 Transcript_110529/m.226119 type:complete len:143 (+) Transcript_110529:105-533(+)